MRTLKIELRENSCIIDGIEYEKKEQPTPKDGEIMFVKTEFNKEWIFIQRGNNNSTRFYACVGTTTKTDYGQAVLIEEITILRPATCQEIALLHTKLKENGKCWNPDTKTLEDYRELKVGELAIFWNFKDSAIIAPYRNWQDGIYMTTGNLSYANAIPFESIEQYREFIKS